MSPPFDITTPIQDVYAAYPGLLTGRSFIVTGATSGLGLAFAKFIAGHGAGTVIITGRSEEKLKQPLADLEAAASASGGKTAVKSLRMDLTDYDSIKRAAAEVIALGIKIDIVLNNAGIMAVPYKKINGYESQFVANHLGHFLFTNLIIDTLPSGSRIVNASSIGHAQSSVRFDDINFQDGAVYNKWQAYGQSKSANVLFAKGLTAKYKSRGIESFSVHPGSIDSTGLGNHLDLVEEGILNPDGTYNPQFTFTVITTDQGIATYLFASISPELEGKGGTYLTESQIQETKIPLTDEDALKLWDLSNHILHTSF